MEKEIITVLISASPIVELRGAIPVAVLLFKFSAAKAYALSVFGNLLPVLPLYLFLHYAAEYLAGRFFYFRSFIFWVFSRTRKYHGKKFELMGALGLFVLVAIPLPATGVWTATVCAFLFGIPMKKAFFAIVLGILAAGAAVLALTLSIQSIA